jgi:DNA-binding transcriptional MerR regulator
MKRMSYVDEHKAMLIGDLAQASGVPAKTIRYYEEIDLLPAPERAENGYRLYDARDVQRLQFIRNARELDFSLDDLKEVLTQRERGQAPCVHVTGLLVEKMGELEERIRHLQELRQDLGEMLIQAQDLPTDDVTMERCVCSLIRAR